MKRDTSLIVWLLVICMVTSTLSYAATANDTALTELPPIIEIEPVVPPMEVLDIVEEPEAEPIVVDELLSSEEEPVIQEAPDQVTEEETPKAEPKPAGYEVDQHDLEMLACVIYKEAGGDNCCDDCRRRVADVVLNRVNSDWYPDTIEEVLTQYRQYNTFCWTGVVWPERASEPGEQAAVERAYRIAEEVLRGNHTDLYGDTYYGQAEFRQGKSQIECCGIYFSKF